MIFLPAGTLMRYILHVSHAIIVLNPHLGSSQNSVASGIKRIQKALDLIQADAILADDGLDNWLGLSVFFTMPFINGDHHTKAFCNSQNINYGITFVYLSVLSVLQIKRGERYVCTRRQK